jgi:hypothetical protein
MPDPARLTRRRWLTVGGLGAFGLTLPGLLSATDRAKAAKDKSVILLFVGGGPPQHETWDPKPDAPAEVRGELGTIPTATPGLRVGEHMPRTAKLTEKVCVLRAMETRDNAHSSSGFTMSTGVYHSPQSVENFKPGVPNDFPNMGAVVRKFLPDRGGLPGAVTLPGQAANDGGITWPGQDAGFLGRRFDPWVLTGDPNAPAYSPEGLAPLPDLPADRISRRRELLAQLDRGFGQVAPDGGHAARVEQAADLVGSPAARRAFDLGRESPKVRDRYGRTTYGQCLLLARRLVEAGVRLVRVNFPPVPGAPNGGSWDTHTKNAEGVKMLLPVLDAAYSALLEDLDDRGLLDTTLVVWTSEFGRTPKFNAAGGRDHWGQVFSSALAGGGVRGGRVIGASDKHAAYPVDGVVRPWDFTATVFHFLGVPPDGEVRDTLDRPLPVTRGEVVKGVF